MSQIVELKESRAKLLENAKSIISKAKDETRDLTSDESVLKIAGKALGSHERFMKLLPMAAGQMLVALEMLLNDPLEIVVCPGDNKEDLEALLAVIWSRFLPNKVVAVKTADLGVTPLFHGREAKGGIASVFICRGNTCEAPVHNPSDLAALLDSRKSGA